MTFFKVLHSHNLDLIHLSNDKKNKKKQYVHLSFRAALILRRCAVPATAASWGVAWKFTGAALLVKLNDGFCVESKENDGAAAGGWF